MNQLTTHIIPKLIYLSEQRKKRRQDGVHLLAITEKGTGQIIDISREGFSFGCLYPHTFPLEFYIDILDAKGSHIKNIRVRKMRETSDSYQEFSEDFELVVGVEFCDLSLAQSQDLDYLLETMELSCSLQS